jgi:hypothetical protein
LDAEGSKAQQKISILKEKTMPYRKINVSEYLGKRFGRLTIVGRSLRDGKRGKGYIWDCVCDCGRKVQVMAGHLYGRYKGKTRSCGCLHDETSRRFRAPGETGLLKVFKNYKEGAKNRELNFDLTFEEFKTLTLKNCSYCDTPPSRRSIINNCRSGFSVYYYNGIDRIDSSKGYQSDNVVPCCYSCNLMKLNYSREDFLRHIAIIYRRHEKEINQISLSWAQPSFNHAKNIPILEIAIRKIENKTDSIFYALKNVARIRHLNKDYILTTSGAYRFIYLDALGKKHHGNDFSSVLKKWTDKDIQNLHATNSIRNWGQFVILIWTKTIDTSAMKIYPAGSSYEGAFKTFANFVKTETKIKVLQEEYKTQRNTVRKSLCE